MKQSIFKNTYCFKKIIPLTLLGLATSFFSSCNLFNPTNSEGTISSNAESYFDEAYKEFRDGKYEKSLNYFNRSIARDSAYSESYLGAAKATLGIYNINIFTLLGEVRKAESGEIPFFGFSAEKLSDYTQGIHKALPFIRELVRRDSLAAQNKKPGKSSSYSNRKITYNQIAAGYAIFETASSLLKFRSKTESLNLQIQFNDEGKLDVNMNRFYEQALNNPEKATELNEALKMLESDTRSLAPIIESASEVIDLSAFIDSDDSSDSSEKSENSVSESVLEDVQGTVNDLGTQILFYQINDGIDNDGDGCVDEEVQDGKDNDSDGLIDEDLRITPLMRLSNNSDELEYAVILIIAADGKDHDMNQVTDDIKELTFAVDSKKRLEKNDFRLLFAAVPDFSNTSDTENKQKVMNDTDSLHIQYDLKWRQKNIGGCWDAYNEEMFKNWFRGR